MPCFRNHPVYDAIRAIERAWALNDSETDARTCIIVHELERLGLVAGRWVANVLCIEEHPDPEYHTSPQPLPTYPVESSLPPVAIDSLCGCAITDACPLNSNGFAPRCSVDQLRAAAKEVNAGLMATVIGCDTSLVSTNITNAPPQTLRKWLLDVKRRAVYDK